MDNKDIAKEWFIFAKRDLDTALHLIKTNHIYSFVMEKAVELFI